MKFHKSLEQNPNRLVLIFLSLWLALNLLQGVFTELADDEAYYWFICRPLEWGFFDHPPMISLLTLLGINTLGDTAIGVRVFSIILQPLYLYLFWCLVRTPRSTVVDAWLYCVLAFSIPMLQLYGFIATPDASLMMSVALTLWSYNRFTDPKLNETLSRQLISIVLLAVSFALMAYSKYHGALVVVCIMASNPRLLLNWRFYTASFLAVILIVPHLLWQWQHDWITFNYHLVSRNSDFQWFNVVEYLLNTLATFNMFVLPLFAMIIVKYRRGISQRPPLERALIWMAWGFFIFFLFSTKRGHVQPQWLIPVVFSLLYFVVHYCANVPKMRRYVVRTSIFMGGLYLLARVFIMSYGGDAINFEIFNNKATYADITETVGKRPIILAGRYTMGAKINFYTQDTTRAFSRPSVQGRNSQWSLPDIDTKFYGKPVAQELNPETQNKIEKGELSAHQFLSFKYRNSNVYYDTVDFYIPTHRVKIYYRNVPEKVLIKQQMALDLVIENPYDFDIPLTGTGGFRLMIQFSQGRFFHCDIEMPITHTILAARGDTRITTTVEVPSLDTGKYMVGFYLMRPPFDAWFNSQRSEIQIVNPKSRM